MEIIEKTLSNFTESQFPQYYRENGPNFVKFVETYYKWMESANNTIYHARHIYEYKDIDETIDEFIIYFKETYLKNIQLDTIEQTRQLVKHSLDLYRSKGTERGIDLFFRAVFGVETSVYYPGSDLFKLSDGIWIEPVYLELSINDNTKKLANKEIIGLTSGARAFCERFVRRVIGGELIDVIFISVINGNFRTGELINSIDRTIHNLSDCPTIVGSLTRLELDVNGSGFGFEIGDILELSSNSGINGKARVAKTTSSSGLVTFDLIDRGYGFTNNSLVYISEKVLFLSNVSITSGNSYFYYFDTISQNYANLNYLNATANLSTGDRVYTYYSNNTLKGTGTVIAATSLNSTAGELRVTVDYGSLNDNTIHTTANVIAANLNVINGYFSMTATGTIMAEATNTTIHCSMSVDDLIPGEVVEQYDDYGNLLANGTMLSFSRISTNIILDTRNNFGAFKANRAITGRNSGSVATVTSVDFLVGVVNVHSEFITDNTAFLISGISNTVANCTRVGKGVGANVVFSSDRLYTENVVLNNDLIRDHLTQRLNANTYGFHGNTSGNLANMTIAIELGFANYTIGALSRITSFNPGSDYNVKPFVRVIEPLTLQYHTHDYLMMSVSNVSGIFITDELIYQGNTTKGRIDEIVNNSTLYIQRYNLFDSNTFSINSTSIVGQQSNASATITLLTVNNDSKFIGDDAIVNSVLIVGNGAVTSLDVLDSGFNYKNGETVTFSKDGVGGEARAISEKQGKGRGFYYNNGGFLSDNKKLFDGHYWQNFSYEIKSPLNFENYKDMLKNILHPAGTIAFSSIRFISQGSSKVNIKKTVITAS